MVHQPSESISSLGPGSPHLSQHPAVTAIISGYLVLSPVSLSLLSFLWCGGSCHSHTRRMAWSPFPPPSSLIIPSVQTGSQSPPLHCNDLLSSEANGHVALMTFFQFAVAFGATGQFLSSTFSPDPMQMLPRLWSESPLYPHLSPHPAWWL